MTDWVQIIILATTLASVVDGDTLRMPDKTLVRLQGHNAPETVRPHCPREKELGEKAKTRLSELMSKGPAALEVHSGSCAYGRACGTLKIKGVSVGETLISEGLAEAMICKGGRCPRPKDWCND